MADDEYMTVAEFAELPADERHAVWAAHARGLVGAIREGDLNRYHREDAQAAIRKLALR